MKNVISNHVKDAADHIEHVSKTVFAKIAKRSLTALRVALGVLSLIFTIKKVVDRFFQMFDSRREYESRTCTSFESENTTSNTHTHTQHTIKYSSC